MSLMADLNRKALERGVPLSVHLDVTYRCNERCEHCYLDHDGDGEMTTAEINPRSISSPPPASSSSPSAAASL